MTSDTTCKQLQLAKLTLLKPGSILPERTTTTGDSLPVTTIKAFHIIRAEVTIIPKRKRQTRDNLEMSKSGKAKKRLTTLQVKLIQVF